MSEEQILGVEIKELKSFPDERGFFREVLRVSDPCFEKAENFAQWSHSKMGKNTVKAWHFHHLQTDWWYCGIGLLHTVLFDLREESPTFRKKFEILMGEKELGAREVVLRIPPGVAHGCKVLSEPAHLFYVTSRTYDPNDEGRYPYDSDVIGHDWGAGEWIVSERDKKIFIPTAPRVKLPLS
jgi:dTDP-4-dehydrorhamnose 3,5-epimerase